MLSALTFLHVTSCILLILLVLIQQGKGADTGSMFGGGGGNTFFGAAGAGNFLTKLTTIFAAVFFTTSVSIAASTKSIDRLGNSSVFSDLPSEAELDKKETKAKVPAKNIPSKIGGEVSTQLQSENSKATSNKSSTADNLEKEESALEPDQVLQILKNQPPTVDQSGNSK